RRSLGAARRRVFSNTLVACDASRIARAGLPDGERRVLRCASPPLSRSRPARRAAPLYPLLPRVAGIAADAGIRSRHLPPQRLAAGSLCRVSAHEPCLPAAWTARAHRLHHSQPAVSGALGPLYTG